MTTIAELEEKLEEYRQGLSEYRSALEQHQMNKPQPLASQEAWSVWEAQAGKFNSMIGFLEAEVTKMDTQLSRSQQAKQMASRMGVNLDEVLPEPTGQGEAIKQAKQIQAGLSERLPEGEKQKMSQAYDAMEWKLLKKGG